MKYHQEAGKLTKFHTGAAERGGIIGHLEMTDDAPGETQMLDKGDRGLAVKVRAFFIHTKMHL